MSKNLKDSLKYGFHNLKTLTNSNSGLIVYPDTTTLAINWENIDGIPRSMGGSYLQLDNKSKLYLMKFQRIDKQGIMKHLLSSNAKITYGWLCQVVTDLDEDFKIITIDGWT